MNRSPLGPGDTLDGFVVERVLHAGSMARIFAVHYAQGARDPGFPMVMKVPRMGSGDGPESIVGFETEHRLLPLLTGPHVPRFVACGDLAVNPYLVMEHVPGRTYQELLDPAPRLELDQVVSLGLALARACHSLHRQNVVHQDLKPANVMWRDSGLAVLLDFGLSHHAELPDLLAEETRQPIGTHAYMAPEQVLGIRGDSRSDLFAVGVMLYEMLTGELPFGDPKTAGGLRQRLWMDPVPPRRLRPDVPPWLQEVVLRLLEPQAEHRYPSAKHLVFDLEHPGQVAVGARGQRLRGTPWHRHLRRWLRAAGLQYEPSTMPSRQIDEVPIVLVAVPHGDVGEGTLYSLRQASARSLGARPGARLACITVTPSVGFDDPDTQRRLLEQLRRWAEPLDLRQHQVSFHVLESADVAGAIVRYAKRNTVSIIVMGAATHGLKLQPIVPTIPIKVAMQAPCTVMLVKEDLPVLSGVDPDDD
ncbi:MAG: protein kinase [Burkholderiales bacterium]|nr:protein kinase [Burkholderiales bacterium]